MSKTLIIKLLFLLNSFMLFSQQKDSLLLNHYRPFQIDSICNSIDSNKELIERRSEGSIIKNKKTIGGFSKYELEDKMSGGTLLRVKYHYSTDLYYKYTFYYSNNSESSIEDTLLIKAILVIEDWNSGRPMKQICSTEYYFENNTPIKIIGEDLKYSNSETILLKGLDYQTDFYQKND